MKTLQQVQRKIPKSVRLIAVSKGQPVERIREVLAAGQRDFGENYVQELVEKGAALAGEKMEWHFVGHLQKNKVGKVLGIISWLHSLDSLELAEVIQKRAVAPLKCLLEINLADEKSKTGLSKEEALALIPQLKAFDKIDLKGLMTISPVDHFKELFSLLKAINQRYLYPRPLTELSMGMSGDFETAIKEGATMVRIGSAIFGERTL